MSDELQVGAAIGRELSPAVADFAAAITGSPTQQVAEWIADHVRVRRYRAQLRLWKRATEATVAAGLPARAVPLKTLLPLIDAASVEDSVEDGADDDSMPDRWANLLANAATESDADVHPSFPGVLRELDSLDARILDFLYADSLSVEEPHGRHGSWEGHQLEAVLGCARGSIDLARIDNLVRLGVCFYPTTSLGKLPVGRMNEPVIRRDRVALAAYGVGFIRACRPPERRGDSAAD